MVPEQISRLFQDHWVPMHRYYFSNIFKEKKNLIKNSKDLKKENCAYMSMCLAINSNEPAKRFLDKLI